MCTKASFPSLICALWWIYNTCVLDRFTKKWVTGHCRAILFVIQKKKKKPFLSSKEETSKCIKPAPQKTEHQFSGENISFFA